MAIKVLQLINTFSTGGAELMVKRLALRADPNRVRHEIWSLCSFVDPAREAQYTADLDAQGVRHYCFKKVPGKKDGRVVKHMAEKLRAGGYDIIHMHCPSPSYYGRLAALMTPRIQTMVTIHNHINDRQVTVERLSAWATDLYVACSTETEQDLLHRCRFSPGNVIRILNGVGEDRTLNVQASRAAIRERFNIAPDEQVALVLGRITRQKAQLDLLEALVEPGERIRRLKVLMVGNDSEEYARRVRASIAEKQLAARVQILGMVDDETVNALFKGADLFLLPSLHEGMSVAILEALRSGLPTVVSDLDNNREVTDNGRLAWLTPPGAPKELARHLEQVLRAPEELARRAREAALYVQEHFSFDRVVREYTEAYERMVSERLGR